MNLSYRTVLIYAITITIYPININFMVYVLRPIVFRC